MIPEYKTRYEGLNNGQRKQHMKVNWHKESHKSMSRKSLNIKLCPLEIIHILMLCESEQSDDQMIKKMVDRLKKEIQPFEKSQEKLYKLEQELQSKL